MSNETSRSVVITVNGVGGPMGPMPAFLRQAVRSCGAPHMVVHFPWSHGFGRFLADLRDRKYAETKAAELALKIREFKQDGQKVSIVAKSGGTAIALKALEQLDENTVENVILLSPAVSPNYDLCTALNAVRSKMYSFHSTLDLFWLGLCTTVFGTMDGVHTQGAGCIGFIDLGRSTTAYAKLVQNGWTWEMCRFLNFGGHSGTSMPAFLAKCVVPLLTADDVNRVEMETEPISSDETLIAQ